MEEKQWQMKMDEYENKANSLKKKDVDSNFLINDLHQNGIKTSIRNI